LFYFLEKESFFLYKKSTGEKHEGSWILAQSLKDNERVGRPNDSNAKILIPEEVYKNDR
jgi:hypothetical protein